MPYLWKCLRYGLKSSYFDFQWKEKTWYKCEKKLEMCESVFHGSKLIFDAMRYVQPDIIAKVQVKGGNIIQSDKQCWEYMRIVKYWKLKKKDHVAISIYCAELVLHNFEREYPDDKRVRNAIEVAKKWLKIPSKKNAASAARAGSAVKEKIDKWIKENILNYENCP